MLAKKRPAKPRNVQTQLRMDGKLKGRIRAYREKIRQSTGIEPNFSAAVRVLIVKGLKQEKL